MINSPSWQTISERAWGPILERRFPRSRARIERVFPHSPAYAGVVRLRFSGLVETGFLNERTASLGSMRLPRDEESIILAMYVRNCLVGTLTLNCLTARYPIMAMELDKGVALDHPHFRSPHLMELTKLVVAPEARSCRSSLDLLTVSLLVARQTGKSHFWQVSRDVPADIRNRERLGFDYSLGHPFADRSLGGMRSRAGYLSLETVLRNPRIPPYVRALYRNALTLTARDETDGLCQAALTHPVVLPNSAHPARALAESYI